MKVLLGIVSLLLTVAAVLLTSKVMQPPAKTKGLGLKADPVPPKSEHVAAPLAVAADVSDDQFDRVVRQNLFHPDRTWIDPLDALVDGSGDDPTEGIDEVEEPSEADNFELIGIARIGDKGAAVIKVIPPKPKPAVRSRRPTTRTPVPSRTVRPPTPPSAAGTAADGEKVKDTKVYSLDEAIGETGYVLAVVGSVTVDLKHEASGKVITLEMDKFDDASAARRKEAATAADKRAKETEARVKAAQQQAAAAAKVAIKKPAAAATTKAPTAPPPPPSPTAPAANEAAQTDAAAERAERLERIREQFRQRLEQRRQQEQEKP